MNSQARLTSIPKKGTSLYGLDLTNYITTNHEGLNAYGVALRALTHGGIYPVKQAINAIGLYDRAALGALERNTQLQVEENPAQREFALSLYVNTLGRLHIRPLEDAKVLYSDDDRTVELGTIVATAAIMKEIEQQYHDLRQTEAAAFAEIKKDTDQLHARGDLPRVLDEVIDHIEHVESVGFYVEDRFLALIDRFTNLIDDRRRPGFLSILRNKPYDQWDVDEILVVAALHALFTSGRSVRFEEFNGTLLSAQQLLQRLEEIAAWYGEAGCEVEMPPGLGLFERAEIIRKQTLCAPGKPWLRYRWIYGLNFQKTERILEHTNTDEASDIWFREFGEDYAELVSSSHVEHAAEQVTMMQLANTCILRDVAGIPCDRGSRAVTSWIEYLIEKIVISAMRASHADYGMSSSIRDINNLVTFDSGTLIERIHGLTPTDFFTCFVSDNLVARVGCDEATVIATTVQKRMMFNRWHFIPGNMTRSQIHLSRHWYYPPLVPDIAIHSDMHRAAHNRARVKYSIRCPGPDMSRPPLAIGRQLYRGFYDVRVVRMDGSEFSLHDLLLVRRRTLWLEAVYASFTTYLMSPGCKPLTMRGFHPGDFYDIVAGE